MRLASVYDWTRSSWIVVRYQGMMVSGMVGSVEAELTIGISALRLTLRPIWVESAPSDPSMAQTLSSYAIFTISLLEAPPPGPHAGGWHGVKRRAILAQPRFKFLS